MTHTYTCSVLAEKMQHFAVRMREAGSPESLDALSQEAAEIEQAYHRLSREEQALLRETSKNTIVALERYISEMHINLEQTSDALQALSDSEDAADAYASAQQHASGISST